MPVSLVICYLPAPVAWGLAAVALLVWWNQLKGDLWLAWVVVFCFLLWAVLVVDLESFPEPAPMGPGDLCHQPTDLGVA